MKYEPHVNSAFVLLPTGNVFSPISIKIIGISVPFPSQPIEHKVWFNREKHRYPDFKSHDLSYLPRGRVLYQDGKYALYMWRWFYDHWNMNLLVNTINHYFNIKIDPKCIYDDPWGDYIIDVNMLEKMVKNNH